MYVRALLATLAEVTFNLCVRYRTSIMHLICFSCVFCLPIHYNFKLYIILKLYEHLSASAALWPVIMT